MKNFKIGSWNNINKKSVSGKIKFAVIIPSYNNKRWFKRNLISVFRQNYKNWRIIYIDDCSTDNTYDLVKNFINQQNMEKKVTLIKNKTRNYQAFSRHEGYMKCDDEEICVLLDGDDWLANEHVFNILKKEYTKHKLVLTYGAHIYFHKGRTKLNKKYGTDEYPDEIIRDNSYRSYGPFVAQHLRTVKAEILKKIPIEQLKDNMGNWLKKCTDVAEMYWALENSNGKFKNIKKVLLIYNVDNSIQSTHSYINDTKSLEGCRNRDEIYRHIVKKACPQRNHFYENRFLQITSPKF